MRLLTGMVRAIVEACRVVGRGWRWVRETHALRSVDVVNMGDRDRVLRLYQDEDRL